MIPVNTGKYKSKVREWIRLYEKRLEQYRIKYGERNFKFKHHKKLINHKIKEWNVLLKASEIKPNKAMIARKLVIEAKKQFGVDVIGAAKVGFGSKFEDSKYIYFMSKYFVDIKLVQVSSNVLKIVPNTMYCRRRMVNKWMAKSQNNKIEYIGFRNRLNDYMFTIHKSATISSEQTPKHLLC
jgi:hypothetical protein